METLQSYVAGDWIAGTGKMSILVNPTTEEPLAQTSTEGIDFGKAVAYARDRGRPRAARPHLRRSAASCSAPCPAIHGTATR